MRPLYSWSFGRVVAVCGAWVALCILFVVAWVVVPLSGESLGSSGSGGIGAVSVGISELALAIPFGPPIVLVVAWLLARRRRKRTQVL
jgi:hypothetical protein